MGCGASSGKPGQVKDGNRKAKDCTQALTAASPGPTSYEDPIEDFARMNSPSSPSAEMIFKSVSSDRSERGEPSYQMRRSRSTIEKSASMGMGNKSSLSSLRVSPRSIHSNDNIEMVYESMHEDHSIRVEVVQEVWIFKHLAPHQLDLVAEALVERDFHAGDHVVTQGEIGNSFFVVRGGEVEVLISGKKIRSMGVNAYFGERALLFDEPRTATVLATEQVKAWEIEKSMFLGILSTKMRQQLMHRIELQDTNVKLDDLICVKQIGEGAYGVVDLVEHKNTKTWYALKKVKKVDGETPSEVVREMDLLAMNDHPFVMHLVKTFDDTDFAYMLTELIPGGEMHSAIRQIDGCFTQQQAQFYIGSLLLGVEALHLRCIIFRDLKPENVMLDGQGYLKIIDFGIAKKLETPKTYTIIGTAHYMAPEVMRGKGYGLSVDIWALGIMLFELVCGYLPFGNDLEDQLEIAKLILKAQLIFPDFYKNGAGKGLIEGLCCRQAKKRWGAGADGYEEIKEADFFAIDNDATGDLFDQLMGRELDPPVLPFGALTHEHVAKQAARGTRESGVCRLTGSSKSSPRYDSKSLASQPIHSVQQRDTQNSSGTLSISTPR